MQEEKSQSILTQTDEESYWLADAAAEIPYSALPLERPQIISISGRVEAFSEKNC